MNKLRAWYETVVMMAAIKGSKESHVQIALGLIGLFLLFVIVLIIYALWSLLT